MLWLMYFATSTGEASAMTDKAIRLYAGKEKVFEYEQGMAYEEVKDAVRRAMDRFLSDAIL